MSGKNKFVTVVGIVFQSLASLVARSDDSSVSEQL